MITISQRVPLAIVIAMILLSCHASAKVASLSLRGIQSSMPGRYVSRVKDDAALMITPLTMASIKGNPTVTYRVYMAAGAVDDTSLFTMIRSESVPFLVIYTNDAGDHEWRLDQQAKLYPLDTALRDLPSGKYSIYVTADDGEGESPPSNILIIELAPAPSEVLSAPVVEQIISPATGLVVLRLAPMQFVGEGTPTLWFNVYRAEGITANPDDFRIMTWGSLSAPEPRNLFDDLPGGIADIREISIVGMKSGDASFYVTVQLERGLDREFLASNIVSVRVAGDNPHDSPTLRLTHIGAPSGVSVHNEREEPDGGSPFPNPASGTVHLPIPEGEGEMVLRIFNVRGSQVFVRRESAAGAHFPVDLSSLPAGAYRASISRGDRFITYPVIIAR